MRGSCCCSTPSAGSGVAHEGPSAASERVRRPAPGWQRGALAGGRALLAGVRRLTATAPPTPPPPLPPKATHLAVSWVLGRALAVAHRRLHHARHALERQLRAPAPAVAWKACLLACPAAAHACMGCRVTVGPHERQHAAIEGQLRAPAPALGRALLPRGRQAGSPEAAGAKGGLLQPRRGDDASHLHLRRERRAAPGRHQSKVNGMCGVCCRAWHRPSRSRPKPWVPHRLQCHTWQPRSSAASSHAKLHQPLALAWQRARWAHIKRELLASQRVVGIDGDALLIYCCHHGLRGRGPGRRAACVTAAAALAAGARCQGHCCMAFAATGAAAAVGGGGSGGSSASTTAPPAPPRAHRHAVAELHHLARLQALGRLGRGDLSHHLVPPLAWVGGGTALRGAGVVGTHFHELLPHAA